MASPHSTSRAALRHHWRVSDRAVVGRGQDVEDHRCEALAVRETLCERLLCLALDLLGLVREVVVDDVLDVVDGVLGVRLHRDHLVPEAHALDAVEVARAVEHRLRRDGDDLVVVVAKHVVLAVLVAVALAQHGVQQPRLAQPDAPALLAPAHGAAEREVENLVTEAEADEAAAHRDALRDERAQVRDPRLVLVRARVAAGDEVDRVLLEGGQLVLVRRVLLVHDVRVDRGEEVPEQVGVLPRLRRELGEAVADE